MVKQQKSLATSSQEAEVAQVGTPSTVKIEEPEGFDLFKYRDSDEGKDAIAWALNEFSRCKTARTQKQRVWYENMAFVFGHQWVDFVAKSASGEFAGKVRSRQTPPYVQRRTVNRIRQFVRQEQSKFLSTLPVVSAVPATAEEEDVRSAYAAEQVWQSYTTKGRLRREYSSSIWWMVLTGNGFMKAWWDPTVKDKVSGQPGDIVYRSVTPFHIYVPDLRTREIDDQPYIMHAQVKTLEWAKQFYGAELEGTKVKPSTVSANTLLDDAYHSLTSTPKSNLDSVVVLEMWVKPGTSKHLPHGGLFVFVEDVLVGAFLDGMPYDHEEYPFTKIEHLSNDSFYADSPIVDLIQLQREYNEIRTQIGVSAKRMGSPQLLAQQGSIIPGRMTNEPGQIIQFRPGTPPPQPMPLQPLPPYVVEQLGIIVQDFEDLSGQHEISKGQAPTGIEAGTALAFLKESDDQFLTPQYQNIEDGFERIARQTLVLFQQFVDTQRKIKVIGADGAYDTALLSGADIAGSTDVRVEPGSSIGQSMAAKRATVMDMFAMGILQDPNQALRLLEVGGAQKVLDTVSVAEKKALRENMKIKSLATPEGQQQLQQHMMDNMMEIMGPMIRELNQMAAMDPNSVDPMTGEPEMVTPETIMQNPQLMQMIQQQIPPVVPADDFDLHAIHIDLHNRYRMGQEYETLPDPVKEQFDKHVQMHEMLLQQQMMEQMMAQGMAGPPTGMESEGAGQPTGPGPQYQEFPPDMMGGEPAGMPI